MLTLQALMYIEANDPTRGAFETMPQEPWHPGEGTKLDRVILLNCGEVRTHAKLQNNKNMEEFQQLRNKNVHPFRRTMINS